MAIPSKQCTANLLGLPFLLVALTFAHMAGEVIFSDDFESGVLSGRWEDIKSTRPGDVAIESRSEWRGCCKVVHPVL